MPAGGRKSRAVGHGEDGGVGADADRQRQRRRRGEHRAPPQQAEPVRGILPRVLDPAERPGVAMLFLDLGDVAKGQPRGTPRGVRRQAARLVAVLEQRQVRVELTREVGVRPADAQQVQHAIEETTHGSALCRPTCLSSGDGRTAPLESQVESVVSAAGSGRRRRGSGRRPAASSRRWGPRGADVDRRRHEGVVDAILRAGCRGPRARSARPGCRQCGCRPWPTRR